MAGPVASSQIRCIAIGLWMSSYISSGPRWAHGLLAGRRRWAGRRLRARAPLPVPSGAGFASCSRPAARSRLVAFLLHGRPEAPGAGIALTAVDDDVGAGDP